MRHQSKSKSKRQELLTWGHPVKRFRHMETMMIWLEVHSIELQSRALKICQVDKSREKTKISNSFQMLQNFSRSKVLVRAKKQVEPRSMEELASITSVLSRQKPSKMVSLPSAQIAATLMVTHSWTKESINLLQIFPVLTWIAQPPNLKLDQRPTSSQVCNLPTKLSSS